MRLEKNKMRFRKKIQTIQKQTSKSKVSKKEVDYKIEIPLTIG